MTRGELLGSLSILLQGPLLAGDADALAQRCRHWRAVFPECPLILSVSQTDLSGAAMPRAIAELCDAVVFAPPAMPLPPVKQGLERNNVNLQIAAAKAGLALVATDHVLRIRNDMVFADDRIADYYVANRDLPRGRAPVFGQRILISPWFTLDPQTIERLPFHFSDWFHLGRTGDVRALWDVAPMTAADATHYTDNAMAAGSNHRETGFLSRLGAEQHIVTEALRRRGRPARLRFHNDRSDVARSLRLLADDFMIADFAVTPIVFDKYAHLATAHDIDLVCVTAADWQRLVRRRFVPPATLFAGKIRRARALLAAERPGPPRRWWRLTGR